MNSSKNFSIVAVLVLMNILPACSQNRELMNEAEQVMMRATKYMVEKVSINGGYVWFYLPDPSDQLYISTGEYIRNMSVLINYIKSEKLTIGNH
jgi:hypothetical protein